MNDTVIDMESSEIAPIVQLVPEGHILVSFKYNFRRFPHTPDNIAAQIPVLTGEGDRKILFDLENKKDEEGNEVDPVVVVFKRKTETYSLPVPTPAALGFSIDLETPEGKQQNKVLQSMISTLIDQYGRSLVNAGSQLNATNCNWQIAAAAEADRLSKIGTSAGGVTYSKELLDEVSESFGKYLEAIGKTEKGVVAMQKMVTGRFGVLSVRKYIKGLDLVRANIEGWYANHLTAEQQAELLEVTGYLLERLELAKEPELVETANLF